MKKFLFTLLSAAALVASARAQQAAPIANLAPAMTQSDCASGCSSGACCTSCCKTCVSEPTTKKVITIVYGEKCEDFCVKRCSPFSRLRSFLDTGCCDTCSTGGCNACGRVYTKKVLIKKMCTTEECDYKCVPVCAAPACCPAPDCAPAAVQVAPATPELVPAPKK